MALCTPPDSDKRAPVAPPLDMTENDISALCRLSTATLTMLLLKRGLRNVWIRGANLLEPNTRRIAGPVFTMRFVPGREDLATPASLSSKRSTRYAIEEMPQGSVAVVASCGVDDAGTFGDILCARMARRGAAGLVTDGKMRDVEGIRKTGLPIWCSGVCAPPSVAQLTFVDWQQPVGSGGVAVFPDVVIVADQEGAIVIPQLDGERNNRSGSGNGGARGVDSRARFGRAQVARSLSARRRDHGRVQKQEREDAVTAKAMLCVDRFAQPRWALRVRPLHCASPAAILRAFFLNQASGPVIARRRSKCCPTAS